MPRTVKRAGNKGGGKRHPLNMRTTKETRDRLEAAALANGRSLAQEVEVRLDASFEHDQRIQDVFGSPELFRLMRSIATLMDATGALASFRAGRSRERWMDHPYSYDQAMRAAADVLESRRPAGEIEAPPEGSPARIALAAAAQWAPAMERDPEAALAKVESDLAYVRERLERFEHLQQEQDQ